MTYSLLELRVLLLRVKQIENNVERASKDKGQEETEAGEIHVALCAVRHYVNNPPSYSCPGSNERWNALKFPGRNAGVCSDILHCTAL